MSNKKIYLVSGLFLALALFSFMFSTDSILIFSLLFLFIGAINILNNNPKNNFLIYYIISVALLLLIAKGGPDFQYAINGDFMIKDYFNFPNSLVTPISTLLFCWTTFINGLYKLPKKSPILKKNMSKS
jgi:hypothetical protein